MRWHAQLWRRLAGDDGPDRRALPVSELLAPLPLLAVIVLVGNDWLLKPSAAPRWLTGKLSDVAGLIVFPLLVTAALDLALYAGFRVGARVDFTLRTWKLALAIGATAIGFAAVKLSPLAAGWVAAGLAAGFGHAHIAVDRSDLLALPALALAGWQGRRALARVAPGRVELAARAHRAGRPMAAPFADAVGAGADREAVAALDRAWMAWLDGGPAGAIAAALDRLRRS